MANTTSATTTKRMTVMAFASIPATTVWAMRVDASSHTAPGNRMFVLKSSGSLFISGYVLENSASINPMASSFFLLIILAYAKITDAKLDKDIAAFADKISGKFSYAKSING